MIRLAVVERRRGVESGAISGSAGALQSAPATSSSKDLRLLPWVINEVRGCSCSWDGVAFINWFLLGVNCFLRVIFWKLMLFGSHGVPSWEDILKNEFGSSNVSLSIKIGKSKYKTSWFFGSYLLLGQRKEWRIYRYSFYNTLYRIHILFINISTTVSFFFSTWIINQ